VAVGWMHAFIALVSLLLSLLLAVHMFRISIIDLLSSLWPAFLAGGVMAVAVSGVLNLSTALSSVEQLLLAIPAGAFSYGMALWFASRATVLEVFQKLQSVVSQQRTRIA